MKRLRLNTRAAAARFWVAAWTVLHIMAGSAATLHVWPNSPNPMAPFTNWATAAQTIQEAMGAAQAHDEILVTNGVYATGGRAVQGNMTNRVAVDKAVIVRSLNGPAVTIIQGQRSASTFGDGAIRCVYLADGAVLSGFTLTNGATIRSGDRITERSGGGAWAAAAGAILSNCILAGNWAEHQGGGVYGGTLNHCLLTGNEGPTRGGGACMATLNHCTVSSNSAAEGGGVSLATLNDCVLMGNSAVGGGGACCGVLNNCTVTGNLADFGGGVSDATTLHNCIVYYNRLRNSTAEKNDADLSSANHGRATMNFCCTTPLPTTGLGNIANEPRFVNLPAGNLRLQPGSPCIDAGSNARVSSATDLDERPRIAGARVDMGAYEF